MAEAQTQYPPIYTDDYFFPHNSDQNRTKIEQEELETIAQELMDQYLATFGNFEKKDIAEWLTWTCSLLESGIGSEITVRRIDQRPKLPPIGRMDTIILRVPNPIAVEPLSPTVSWHVVALTGSYFPHTYETSNTRLAEFGARSVLDKFASDLTDQ